MVQHWNVDSLSTSGIIHEIFVSYYICIFEKRSIDWKLSPACSFWMSSQASTSSSNTFLKLLDGLIRQYVFKRQVTIITTHVRTKTKYCKIQLQLKWCVIESDNYCIKKRFLSFVFKSARRHKVTYSLYHNSYLCLREYLVKVSIMAISRLLCRHVVCVVWCQYVCEMTLMWENWV